MSEVLTLFILGSCAGAILAGMVPLPLGDRTRPRAPAFAVVGFLGLVAFVLVSSAVVLEDPWLAVSLSTLAQEVLMPGLAGLAGALVIWASTALRIDLHSGGRSAHAGWLALPVVMLTASWFLVAPPAERAVEQVEETAPAPGPTSADVSARIRASLPAGYDVAALLKMEDLGPPTSMTMGDDGALYLAAGDTIYRFPGAESGDISARQVFAEPVPEVLGLVHKAGVLYASGEGSLLAIRDEDGDGRADDEQVLIEGLPHRAFSVHSNNGLVFDDAGALHMGLGGTSDHGPETHPIAGSILRIDPQTGDFSVYASGLRNPYDLTFCRDGRLFATDNGPDRPDDDLIYRPPDEVNWIREGRDYGYPDFYGYPPPWSDSEGPVALLPFSSAATGILCYSAPPTGDPAPGLDEGDLLVTLWGSRSIPEQTGKRLMRVRLRAEGQDLRGLVETFAAGFENPIDLVQDAAGSVLVADYGAGEVYRISYTPPG